MELDEIFYEYNRMEIENMKKNEFVSRFCALEEKSSVLYQKLASIYIQKKLEEYNSCNHLWVETTGENYNPNYTMSIGCMKCGVDTGLKKKNKPLEEVSLEEQAIMEYSKVGVNKSYDFVDIVCDLDLARAIFKRIDEQYPDLDNQTLAKYFLKALRDIREIKVSEERKKNRAKRLGLHKDFKSWK